MQAFLKGSIKQPTVPKVDQTPGTSKEKPVRNRPQPWVEKYRPRTVDELVYQDEVVAVLRKSLQSLDLPNLLFYGPPGTGKTSAILAASKELFGDIYRQRILELNASDERGINVIREKVKNFSQLTVAGRRSDGRACPSFKIVILDEADSMTTQAQAALRRTMEKESRTTRFCLICNYVSRIIEPITSRCAKFRFKPLARDTVEGRLKEICTRESVNCSDEALAALISNSDGDLRKAITTLQSVARLKGGDAVTSEDVTEIAGVSFVCACLSVLFVSVARLKGGDAVTSEDVTEIAGVIPGDVLDSIIKACQSGSYEKLDATLQNVMAEGYSGSQLLVQLHDVVIVADYLTDIQKSVVCERIALIDKRLMDGADEFLQLLDLCSVVLQQICYKH